MNKPDSGHDLKQLVLLSEHPASPHRGGGLVGNFASPRGETKARFPLHKILAWGVGVAVSLGVGFSVSPAVAAKKFPKHPRWADFQKEASTYEETVLRKIAQCEEPGSGKPWGVKWGMSASTYSSAFGIYNGNGSTMTRVTGYRFPSPVPAEEALNALVLLRIYGPSAWGCGRGL
jgi:hypothetical protein